MRVAFTIVYNGIHHLKHNDFALSMCDMFDLWVIVEGAAGNGGSTSWCKEYHRDAESTDGTREYLTKLKEACKCVELHLADKMWPSKDAMVDKAMQMIRQRGVKECFLWQIDVDEQWNKEDLQAAENQLRQQGAKTGVFRCDYFLSHDLYARGDWGEGLKYPYRRLWDWKGEDFQTHEEPTLKGGNGREAVLSQRFRHYAYLFEKDVYFKTKYYAGHEDVYKPWLSLQIEAERKKLKFPLHISYLFGRNNRFSKTNTYISEK